MSKYRKKPVVIEAIKYQAELGNNRIMNWLSQQGADVAGWTFHDAEITIPTLEGDMRASDGDFIIRGIKGEFYPCKPDVFEATYEPAGNEPDAPFPNPLQIVLGYGRVQIQSFRDKEDRAAGIIFREVGETHEVGSLAPSLPSPHFPKKGEVYVRCDNRMAALTLMGQLADVVSNMNDFEAEDVKGD